MVRSGEVLFNFQAADIQAVVKTVSQMTGRNFLLDPRVKGKVTIISAKPVSKAAAYQIFVSALKAQGFAAVTGPGGIVKVIPVGEGKQNARISTGAKPWGGDQMTTQVIVVQHGVATQMVPLLRPLMAPTSQLSAYAPANALIITDYARNIRRLLKIIGEVDQPLSTEVTVIPLQYSSALDLAELITRLSQARPGSGRVAAAKGAQVGIGAERFTIIPDLRTNSLLVRTDNPGRLSQLRALISKLDVPAKPGGRTRVVYLRNADAEKLVEILRGLLKAEARRAGAAAKGKATDTSLIQADEATNSLIINATDAVYNNLRHVIEKLDVRRAQVFVEALIAEISVDKLSELGFQWVGASSGFRKGDKSGAVGVTNFPLTGAGIINTAIDPIGTLGSAAGLSLAFLGSSITLADGTKVAGLGALARALVQKNYGNILSTPNLLTLDNAEAKIIVGQNVPFVTGSFAQAAGTGTTVNPFQTIQRQDVGITLKIKPQISEGGTIKLEIFQEVSDVEKAVTAAADLITNKRSLETTVVVEDGHTVVLGGLIEDKIKENIQSVPFLGRIPLLGALFRYREKKKEKTNLMVFLRPTIVRKPEDAIGFTASRYDYLRLQDPKKVAVDRARILERFDPSKNKPAPSEDEEDTTALRLDDADELLGPPHIEGDEGTDLEEVEESEES